MRKVFLLAYLVCALPLLAQAQFNSGSTGADGALDLSTCPGILCQVQIPESGVLNYTTVSIPEGKILGFLRNSRNTPVIMLAQGNVIISSIISVDANGQLPGPGGYYGGPPNLNGGVGPNLPGFGPGSGPQSNGNRNGRWVGPLNLSPIVGGSGGSGGSQCTNVGQSPFGGGGGGAIVIASSTSINIIGNGRVSASGGDVQCAFGGAGGGSGGAIRLIANTINVNGSNTNLLADGRGVQNSPPFNGTIRLEAVLGQLIFFGNATPAPTLVPFNQNSPPILITNFPQLTIQSVGGYTVPSYSGSRFNTVDLLLPNQLPDPVSVVVRGNNIPVGTEVRVGFVSGSPSGTSTPCNLAGTDASSQCTATISNLNRTGVTYLLATATFTPPMQLAQYNPKGANQIAKIRLESVLGAKPKYVFLRSDNSAVDSAKVPKEFLQYFGM